MIVKTIQKSHYRHAAREEETVQHHNIFAKRKNGMLDGKLADQHRQEAP